MLLMMIGQGQGQPTKLWTVQFSWESGGAGGTAEVSQLNQIGSEK